jgi:AcrR family transcriptional regulator
MVVQLPRGRHRLTREQVLSSQRGRILSAMARAMAEKGFARTTVADVIALAGVSRETFYEQFADKEDCLLAALDAGAQLLIAVLEKAAAGEGEPLDRLDRVLEAYLDALLAQPEFAKVFLIGAYGAGPRATRRRIELQEEFVELVARVLGARTKAQRFAAEAIVAAVSSMATARVGTGREGELPGLRESLAELAKEMLA